MIIWRTIGRRSSAMNMCSVRQRPIPSAPNSRAFAASSGVSAFARTRSRRNSSAQTSIVAKFSSTCGGTSGTAPSMTRPVPPSIVSTSPSENVVPPMVALPASRRQRVAAGHGRLAHPTRDDGRVRGHAAVRGQHAAGPDEPVDVVRGRLPAHENDVLAGPAAILGGVGVEDDLPGRRARGRVQPLREDLDRRLRVDHRMQELVELPRVDPRHGLLAGDQPLADHVDRDPHRRCGGSLARARLEEVERARPRR